jgi:hypothetical protein
MRYVTYSATPAENFKKPWCRILSEHPQNVNKVLSLHAIINCLMFSVCV